MLETQRLASSAVAAVLQGRNLNVTLLALWRDHPQLTSQQRAAITDLSYGTLRYLGQLEAVLAQLLAKPLRDEGLRWLLLVAIYQLIYTRAAPYAVVDHAVRGAAASGAPHAAGLINGVLRNFQRRREDLLREAGHAETGRYSYPQWWISQLRTEYPAQYIRALEAGNRRPPMTLRVNRRRSSRAAYLELIAANGMEGVAIGTDAVMLARPVPVERLPGFMDGLVSVQDLGAQWAAPLLDASAGMRVLDACAAPGGKTTHLLEIADVDLLAIDTDAARLDRVRQNLERLELAAELRVADAANPSAWWDGEAYDRVLLDAPCSASGVVRRHPDIKWLRRPTDLRQFAAQQSALLDGLWQLLVRGGKLLYTTCSVFQEENSQQIREFLVRHRDAVQLPLTSVPAAEGNPEGQTLPDNEHDGFFYALVQKT